MSQQDRQYFVRQAEVDDVRDLTTMVNSSGGLNFYKAIFGTFHLPSMIDLSYLSLISESMEDRGWGQSGEDQVKEVQGFVVLNDQIPAINDDQGFEFTIKILTDYIPVSVNNTLFINFWMMNENTKNNAAPVDIIKEVYALSPNIDFIVWVCPYSYIVPDFVEKLFSSIILDPATTNIGPLRGYRIMFAHRSNFLPKLTVRNARVEDNDDLIPIIQHSNPDILMGQDRYFLADLIQHQDLNNRFFVGLKKNHIVGMLATSLDVNMSLIMKIFDIDAYPDLIIQSDSIPPPPPLLIGIIGDLRLLEVEGLEEMLYDQNVIVINLEKIAVHLQDYQHGDHASALMNYVQHMMQNFHTPSQLQAVILWGFPRSESEATEHMKTMVHEFDIVLELLNVSEEVDDDEEEDDDFLQQHLDAVEVVRDYYFKDVDHNAGGHGKDKKKAVWRKVSYDQDSYHSNKKDNLVRLHTAVVQCLDERVQRMEAAKVLNKEKPPKANAFAITALCMEEEFSSRSMDLIKLAFEEQPDYAYCLYMVGNQRAPSRETGCLNFIKTRPGISFDQSLYIINRSYFYVQDHLRVARIEEQMMEDIYSFLAPVKQRERMEIVDAMQGSLQENDVSLLDNPYQVSFAIKIGEKTIGTAILTRKILTNEDVNWYRLHYHIDELVNFSRHRTRSQYVLLHWMIDPIFSTWTRLIIRQIMRLCNKTVLYYHSERDIAPPKEIIEDFVFVRPRRVIQGENAAYKNRPQPHQANASEGKEAENGHQSMGVYALGEDAQLFCILKPSLAFKKSLIATRVVILGGSAHSQACLETICSVPYVYYPNIYYIVEVVPGPMKGLLNTGSSNTTETSAAIDELHSKQDKEYYGGCLSLQDVEHPSEGELHAMGYAHRINIIKGHLTDIDRENKAVVISDEFVVEYDYLIISTYQQDNSARLIPSLVGVHPAKCADAGIFALGNPASDLLALSWVKKRAVNRTEPVVICGVALKVLAAAEGLIRGGIEPARIVCVITDAPENIEGCNDLILSGLVANSPQVAGIKQIYWKSAISEVSLSRNGFLQSLELKDVNQDSESTSNSIAESKAADNAANGASNANVRISCTALLLCGNKDYQSCERDVFAAINDSGLVFDGGLVVDLSFRTVDQSIYAVSDYTKFSRVYRDELPHVRYNSREVGIYVAMQIISKHLHPHPEYFKRIQERLWHDNTVNIAESKESHQGSNGIITRPRFSLARSSSANLPGGIVYFISNLPKMPKEIINYLTDNSLSSSVNFGPMPPRRVVSLKMDSLGVVAEVVYAGLDEVEFRNLSVVPGKHEAYLNSAIHAHKRGLVDDWIEFFRGEWTSVLYMDSFSSLVTALKRSLQNDKGMIMLLSRIFEKSETTLDDSEVDEYRRILLGAHGELIPEITKRTAEAESMEYLREHKDFLPKYYMPSAKGEA